MFIKTRKNHFFKFFVFALLVNLGVLASGVFDSKEASAWSFTESSKAGHNFSGFAWSENIGWVSLNSDNCDTDDSGAGDGGSCLSAAMASYGVNLTYRTGDVSGYAWSSNVGWIAFPGVTYNRATGELSGDATVISLQNADDRILRLKSTGANPYKTETKGVAAATVYADEADAGYGVFSGWAWNEGDTDNTGIGWLSFNNTSGGGGTTYAVTANMNYTPLNGSNEMRRTWPAGADDLVVTEGAGATTGVITEGDAVSFSSIWNNLSTDDDYARLFVCRGPGGVDTANVPNPANNVAYAQSGIDTWSCVNGEWGSGLGVTGDGAISCALDNNGDKVADGILAADIGLNKRYYAYLCDQFAACTPAFTSDSFLINDRPNITDVSGTTGAIDHLNGGNLTVTYAPFGNIPVATAPPLLTADPYGNMDDHQLYFEGDWDDDYTGPIGNEEITMYACDDTGFNYDHDDLRCSGTEYCNATQNAAAITSGTINCTGGLSAADVPINPGDELKTFRIFMCDGYGACTEDTEPLATGKFFVNRRPLVDTDMSAPNWNASEAATNDKADSDLQANLIWSHNDSGDSIPTDVTDSYVKVTRPDTSFEDGMDSTGEATCVVATGECTLVMTGQDGAAINTMLSWGTAYSWEARTRDTFAWSDTVVYNTSAGGVLTDDDGSELPIYTDMLGVIDPKVNFNDNGGVPGSSLTFTTFTNNFPNVNEDAVTYFPYPPSAMEEVTAAAHSSVYKPGHPDANTGEDGNSPSAFVECNTAPLNISCSYFWKIPQGPPSVGLLKTAPNVDTWNPTYGPDSGDAIVRFAEEGENQDYTLHVINTSYGYFDSTNAAAIDYVNEQLPSWQEVK